MFLIVLFGTSFSKEGFWHMQAPKYHNINFGLGASASGWACYKIEVLITGKEGMSYGAKISGINELALFGDSPSEGLGGIDFLFGYSFVQRFFKMDLLSGVGKVSQTKRGELIGDLCDTFLCSNTYEKVQRSSLGIPLQISLVPNLKYVGLGVSFMANLNTLQPFAGFVVTLGLGTFW